MISPVRRLVACGILPLTVALVTGCQREVGGRALLPDPPKDQPKLSSYEPASPYRQLGPGVLSRKLFDATGSAEAVEAVDLLVAPGQRAGNVSLPGAAVFEVRAGSGLVTTSGKKEDVKIGSTFALSQGASFTLENTGDVPMTIRVFIITAH